MWKRNRTKLIVSLVCAAGGVLAYFGYSGPSSDRAFMRGCLLVLGVVLALMLAVARVLRCPRCGADMGWFENLPALGRLRPIHLRYVQCRYCGCVIDRYEGNREV